LRETTTTGAKARDLSKDSRGPEEPLFRGGGALGVFRCPKRRPFKAAIYRSFRGLWSYAVPNFFGFSRFSESSLLFLFLFF
jgi:hypothetical protein